jgi:hypothetical protein
MSNEEWLNDLAGQDFETEIEHTSLAIIGGMVPDRLREALAEADDGLAARFFYVWPEPRPIAPLKKCGDTEAAQRREKLAMTARKLRALALGSDNTGTAAPRALLLEGNAYDLFDVQRQEAMRLARPRPAWRPGGMGKIPVEPCGSHWCTNSLLGRRVVMERRT